MEHNFWWISWVLFWHPCLIVCHNVEQKRAYSSPMSDYHRRRLVVQDILNSSVSLIPPSFFTGNTTKIDLQFYFMSVDKIDQMNMEYSVIVYLQMTWVDQRLQYKPFNTDMFQPLELGPELIEKIWVPDLYFINTKKAFLHSVTKPNKYMHIQPNGKIFFSQRLSMVLVCEMNLRKFPFDSQLCHISTESCSHSTLLINLTWAEQPLVFRDGLKLPQFKLLKTKHVRCTKLYVGIVEQYACLRAELYMKRVYDFYITQVYIPSVIVVTLSWISFWLDAEATPARITLGLLTVLTMTSQNSEAKVHLPRVSYFMAIDVWMGTCLLFVFAALVEFAYVNVYARTNEFNILTEDIHDSLQYIKSTLELRETRLTIDPSSSGIPKNTASTQQLNKDISSPVDMYDENDIDEHPRKRLRIASSDNVVQNKTSTTFYGDTPSRLFTVGSKISSFVSGQANQNGKVPDIAKRFDTIAKITFPVAFIVFNIVYWSFYMNWEQEFTLGAAT